MHRMSRGMLLVRLFDDHVKEKAMYLRDIVVHGLMKGYRGSQARSLPSYLYNGIYCMMAYGNLKFKTLKGYDRGVESCVFGVVIDLVLLFISGVGFAHMNKRNPTIRMYGMNVVNIVWLGWCVILLRVFIAIVATVCAQGPEFADSKYYLLQFPDLLEISYILTIVHFFYMSQIIASPIHPATIYLSATLVPEPVHPALPAYAKRPTDSRGECVAVVSEKPCNCTLVEECGICLLHEGKGKCAITLPCSHSFHARCIEIWADHGNSCPMCREKFTLRYRYKPLYKRWEVDSI